MKLATAAEMQKLDRLAIEQAGIPSTTLMTNAAAHIAELAKEVMGENKHALIFCGSGNNGGDGIATAVALMKDGYSVRVCLVTEREKLSEDAREMERRLEELGGALETFDPKFFHADTFTDTPGVIIDAIFGIGLNAEVQGNAEDTIGFINEITCGYPVSPVISVDIASGIEADTGRILGTAVEADYTVTFTLPKPGSFVGQGILYAGEVKIVNIGIPKSLIVPPTKTHLITANRVSLPARHHLMHKGNAGKLLLIGGSVGYTGALTLAAKAALRSGAGLVFMGVPEEIYPIVAAQNLEAMPFPLPSTNGKISKEALPIILERLQGMDKLLIGPGMGQSPELDELVCDLIRTSEVPIILDADGLNAVSRHIDVLDEIPPYRRPILTPHDGEFARLGGDLSHGDRLKAARDFVRRHNCTLVLKGPGTIIAVSAGTVFVNTTGNPGMATGGSGDVLAGMIATLSPITTAVWAHGKAGDLAAEALGEYSMLPSDLLDYIPEVLKSITR
ncbi:MAG: NAD(P)H-hydrate dehydratase [Oscillospiraceae bacterium]|nr:NAD(P)H-hydrate dehydratase [Oscillospiraceae bacterium]